MYSGEIGYTDDGILAPRIVVDSSKAEVRVHMPDLEVAKFSLPEAVARGLIADPVVDQLRDRRATLARSAVGAPLDGDSGLRSGTG